MSIPNWVPQSPKWFNLEATEEHNKDDFSNIRFKIHAFKKTYVLKEETRIISEIKTRQAPSISLQRSCYPPIFIPNSAILAQPGILLHIKAYLLSAYKKRPIQTKA